MLYYLSTMDKSALSEVTPSKLQDLGWLEKDLENLVAKHIDRIVREDQLLVIHQERRFKEEPDIMALDREGGLHIFELKRWEASPENLLQVLRYGQIFGQYDYSALDHLFQNYTMRMGGLTHKELSVAHSEYFELPEQLLRSAFNQVQNFIVVTDGLDRNTREAIDYWSKHGLPVTALAYQVYRTTNGDLLFEIRPYGPEGDTFAELPEGLVVVNTNYTYMPDAWKDMLEKGKASAYYSRKTAVCSISRGSPIALYHNVVGIIAFGKTTDTFRRAPHGDDPDEEYYVPCEFEVTVDPTTERDKAVTAREINGFLGASYRFRPTRFTMPAEAVQFVRDALRKRKGK